MAEIKITHPHVVAELMSKEDRKNHLLLLGMKGNLDGERWKVLLDFIFASIDIPKTRFTRLSYRHIGCTAASLAINLDKGTIVDSSKDKLLKSGHVKRIRTNGQVKASVNPSGAASGLKLKASIESEEGKEEEYTSSVNCEEREIVATQTSNSVEWRIEQPKVPMLVRDYLLGNFPFEAEVRKDKQDLSGNIELKPMGISFFNERNEPISGTKALLFELVLFRKGIRIKNKKGITFNFEVHE